MPASDSRTANAASRHLVTIRQAAQATGISASTIHRRIKDGTLPTQQLGGQGKMHRVSLDDLLATKSVAAVNSAPEPASPSLVSSLPATAAMKAATKAHGRAQWNRFGLS